MRVISSKPLSYTLSSELSVNFLLTLWKHLLYQNMKYTIIIMLSFLLTLSVTYG